jgi:non-specific protein-tyrosine kinase
MSLSDYLRVLWRWKWLILIVVAAATIGAFGYSSLQVPRYMATASILYVEPVDPSDPLGASYYSGATRDLAVENVLDLMGSSDVAVLAEEALQGAITGPYGVTATARSGSTASSLGGVVDVTATSGDPEEAAAVANAYANAIVSWRRSQQLARIKAAQRAVQANLDAYTTEASRLTTDYIMLQQKLSNLKLLETTAEGDFKVVSEAVPPSTPYEPRPLQAAAFGFGVGLLVAVGLAFLLEPLTTKVRGKREAADVLGLPVVGTVPEIDARKLNGGRLAVLADPRGQTAEALRLVRSNLDYFNEDGASSILITSALAGEGKSTMICNLAVTMTLAGRKVVLVDGDIRRPRVHEYFGLGNELGLSSVLGGQVPLARAIEQIELRNTLQVAGGGNGSNGPASALLAGTRVPVPVARTDDASETDVTASTKVNPTLYVVPAGPEVPDPGELVASARFGEVIRELETNGADLVLVDSPALMEVGDAAAMAAQIDALVVVVDLKRAHHATLVEMRHLLTPLPCKQLGAVLVKAKSRSSSYGYYYSS